MIYVALCLLCIVAIESFIFLPVLKPLGQLIAVSRKSTKVLASSNISDHWKEIVLQRYARDMAVSSLLIAFGLALVFVPVVIAAFAIDALLGADVAILDYALTWEGIVIATVFSLGYIFLRNRLVTS